jgi:pyruvate dehydrogenase E2 component (dihydrolipoamide acetyltransferase)
VFADVILPNLGFGMEEGRLVAWLKAPGEAVRKGEPIAEVESDKTTVELEAVIDGVLDVQLAQPGETIAVGAALGRIRTGEAVPQAAPVAAAQSAASAPADISADASRVSPLAARMAQEHGVDLNAMAGSGPGGRITVRDVQARLEQPITNGGGKVLAAPAVRKLARDNGLNLATLHGTGEGGRVTRADVEAALAARVAQPEAAPDAAPARAAAVPAPAAAQPAAPLQAPAPVADGERREIALSNMRQTIARRLAKSMQDAPHFFTTAQLDLTDALAALPAGVGINALLLYLTVGALQDIPDLNATYEDGHLYQYAHVNLAMAVALSNGLITPVLHRADDYSLTGLAERSKDLVSRARAGRLRPEELQNGTFTVSNLGVVDQVERFTAILNPPQVGILAIGAAKERPLVINRGLHIRTTAYVTLSADHRIIDGLLAARFLEALDKRLQQFGK